MRTRLLCQWKHGYQTHSGERAQDAVPVQRSQALLLAMGSVWVIDHVHGLDLPDAPDAAQ